MQRHAKSGKKKSTKMPSVGIEPTGRRKANERRWVQRHAAGSSIMLVGAASRCHRRCKGKDGRRQMEGGTRDKRREEDLRQGEQRIHIYDVMQTILNIRKNIHRYRVNRIKYSKI